MRGPALAIAALMVWGPTPALAQEASLLGRETAFVVAADAIPEPRRVWVSLPESYEAAPDRQYDVLYVLDGRGLFGEAAAHARFMSLFEGAPEMIIVGIDSVSPAARRRDFTPTPGAADPTEAGQADRFLGFLIDTVEPGVSSRYRTSGRAILVGHSLAGLFALHARLSRPEAFDAYVAISPTLSWDQARIIGDIASSLADPTKGQVATPVFVSMAEGDSASYRAAMDDLERAVADRPEWRTARFAGEDHVSTVPAALLRGLRFVRPALTTAMEGSRP